MAQEVVLVGESDSLAELAFWEAHREELVRDYPGQILYISGKGVEPVADVTEEVLLDDLRLAFSTSVPGGVCLLGVCKDRTAPDGSPVRMAISGVLGKAVGTAATGGQGMVALAEIAGPVAESGAVDSPGGLLLSDEHGGKAEVTEEVVDAVERDAEEYSLEAEHQHPILEELGAYHRMKEELERHYHGRWVVIDGGRLVGDFATYEEADGFVMGEGLDWTRCLVRRVGYAPNRLLSNG